MKSFYSGSKTVLLLTFLISAKAYSEANLNSLSPSPIKTNPIINKPLIIPSAPSLNAKAYILIDTDSGKIIAEKNSDTKLPPASLTKMMTLYVISKALHNQQIHLSDTVHISQEAWKMDGSRMFIKEGDDVAVKDLVKGIIVDSGNDACAAMAEHLGGSEAGFAEIMNQQAQDLGMLNSHFTDSTGLPNEQLYSSAKDLAILGKALINDFPAYYHWYKQKWFTYNGIRQPNRNRLLWRNSQVDGIKTGHTDEAGFCLVSSAKRNDMRLLAVVMGSPSESVRADDSERLLNYGFRFFETRKLYQAGHTITEVPVYKSSANKLSAGFLQDQFLTFPAGQYQRLNFIPHLNPDLQAPVKKGDEIGKMVIQFEDKDIETLPLYALEDAPTGGFFSRCTDSIRLLFKKWFG